MREGRVPERVSGQGQKDRQIPSMEERIPINVRKASEQHEDQGQPARIKAG